MVSIFKFYICSLTNKTIMHNENVQFFIYKFQVNKSIYLTF